MKSLLKSVLGLISFCVGFLFPAILQIHMVGLTGVTAQGNQQKMMRVSPSFFITSFFIIRQTGAQTVGKDNIVVERGLLYTLNKNVRKLH